MYVVFEWRFIILFVYLDLLLRIQSRETKRNEIWVFYTIYKNLDEFVSLAGISNLTKA